VAQGIAVDALDPGIHCTPFCLAARVYFFSERRGRRRLIKSARVMNMDGWVVGAGGAGGGLFAY
jgi:hypothetical protein